MAEGDDLLPAAQIGLREATRALHIAKGLETDKQLSESQARGLAADVGRALDAIAAAVQGASHQMASPTAGHTLQALTERIGDAASLARHMADGDREVRDSINARLWQPDG